MATLWLVYDYKMSLKLRRQNAIIELLDLTMADGEFIMIGDKLITHCELRDRSIAMVFQNYAFYPYMSLFDNVISANNRFDMW